MILNLRAFRRGRLLLPSFVYRFNQSITDGIINSRSIILIDPKKSLSDWFNSSQTSQISKVYSLKHPNSGHILSYYGNYFFQHASYNYNQIGEFSLQLSGGNYHDLSQPPNQSQTILSSFDCHDMIILPDAIHIRNLRQDDLKSLFPYLNQNKRIAPTQVTNILKQRMTNSTGNGVQVQNLCNADDDIVVLVNVNPKIFPYQKANELIRWFQESFSSKTKTATPSVRYLITTELDNSNERQNIQCLILPYYDYFHGIFTKKQVETIVERYQSETR
jgi:hypothetical protein